MSMFDETDRKVGKLQYMTRENAEFMRKFIADRDLSSLLEIGFFKGKSTAYFAAILEDLGRGHVTAIDKKTALDHQPNIDDVLRMTGLSHRVTRVLSDRSYTWELLKMMRSTEPPQFDFCYFDGGHTWDATGFGFVLVDRLLKPGGWIIFDDLDWTIEKSLESSPQRESIYRKYGSDERTTPAVRLVFETLVKDFGYRNMKEVSEFSWGVAQKPRG
jgi:predicted O-methyltransferase YrrM